MQNIQGSQWKASLFRPSVTRPCVPMTVNVITFCVLLKLSLFFFFPINYAGTHHSHSTVQYSTSTDTWQHSTHSLCPFSMYKWAHTLLWTLLVWFLFPLSNLETSQTWMKSSLVLIYVKLCASYLPYVPCLIEPVPNGEHHACSSFCYYK